MDRGGRFMIDETDFSVISCNLKLNCLIQNKEKDLGVSLYGPCHFVVCRGGVAASSSHHDGIVECCRESCFRGVSAEETRRQDRDDSTSGVDVSFEGTIR